MAGTKTADSANAKKVKITLSAGMVGKQEMHRKVVRALGLGKFGSSVVHVDSPTIRGMITKVRHLVTVCPAEETACGGKNK